MSREKRHQQLKSDIGMHYKQLQKSLEAFFENAHKNGAHKLDEIAELLDMPNDSERRKELNMMSECHKI